MIWILAVHLGFGVVAADLRILGKLLVHYFSHFSFFAYFPFVRFLFFTCRFSLFFKFSFVRNLCMTRADPTDGEIEETKHK